MADIFSIDKMRIQTENPCNGEAIQSLNINTFSKEYYSSAQMYYITPSNVTEESITIDDRTNCDENKIIAWFIPRYEDDINRNTYYDFGTNNEQVVLRVVGNCLTTEIRESSSIATFEPNRYVSGDTNNFGVAKLYCGCNNGRNDCSQTSQGGSCCCLGLSFYEGFEVVTSACTPNQKCGEETPCDDIYHNETYPSELKGLVCPNVGDLFVEYGTEKSDDDGSISANCIVNTSDIYFLYIPCGHYTHKGDNNNSPGYIEDGAFSGLTQLRGIWIAHNSDKYFSYRNGTNPFDGCNNLEIVYYPPNDIGWLNYFTINNFSNLKFVNGKYIEGA